MASGPQDEDANVLLSTATALSLVGTFRWDLASDRLDLSDRARQILTVTDGGAPTAEAVIDRAVHPDERGRARDQRERSRTDAVEVPAGEWQLVDPNERVRWVAMAMRPAPARDRPARMLGSLLDVTERHEWRYERELYLSALALVRGAEPGAAAEALIAGLEADGRPRLSAETEEAVRAVVAEMNGRTRNTGESPLTTRETEVLQLASHGGASAAIAEQLHVSTSTVKTHLEHIYAKLGTADRAGAVAEGLRRGLIV